MDDQLQKWIDTLDMAVHLCGRTDDAVTLKRLSDWLVAKQDDLECLLERDRFDANVAETERRIRELEAKMKDARG